MAAIPPLIGIQGVQLALTICGASVDQRNSIINEGFNEMSDLLYITDSEIETMMSNITRLRAAQGGIRIGALLTKKVKTLAYWAKEQERQGLALDAYRFTQQEMTETLKAMMVDAADDDSKPELPGKFEVHKWVSWSKKFENYLWQIKGRNNTPLAYVTRKTRAANAPPFESPIEENIYMTAHQGPAYARDNQKVFEILTQQLHGTPAWTWISPHEAKKSGKAAYAALRVHYDGPGEIMKRNNYAYRILETTYYKSERSLTFEGYVTKLSEAFEILKDNGMEKNELERVKILLDGIQSDNTLVQSAKTNVVMDNNKRTSFQVAVDCLSEFIGSTFTGQVSPQGKRPARNISRMEMGGRGRGGRGRGGGRGGRGNRGGNHKSGKIHNGVDISDLTRNFTKDEWTKLSTEVIQQIKDARTAAKENAKKRKVAAAAANPDDSAAHQVEDEPSEDIASNGSNFGSGAYRNKRVHLANRQQGNT